MTVEVQPHQARFVKHQLDLLNSSLTSEKRVYNKLRFDGWRVTLHNRNSGNLVLQTMHMPTWDDVFSLFSWDDFFDEKPFLSPLDLLLFHKCNFIPLHVLWITDLQDKCLALDTDGIHQLIAAGYRRDELAKQAGRVPQNIEAEW